MADDERVDVVVVGAGPAGATLAGRLSAAGVGVLVLERGEPPDPALHDGGRPDWELLARGPLSESPAVRRAPADVPMDASASDVAPMVWHGVGGGTVLWGAQWERLLPSDFATRTLDGVGDDWPLTYDELAPYYGRVDRLAGVSALAGDPAFPSAAAAPHPPLPIMEAGRRVARAHNALGWHWWPGPNAISPERCRLRGVCAYGCPHAAKWTGGWPAAARAGARLRTSARVIEVLTNGGRATGVAYVEGSPGSATRRVRADVVVLAAGAVNTPRLLLLSGLEGGSGLMGRRLMLHPYTRAVGLWDEPLDGHQGQWGQLLHSLEFAETDPARGHVRGAKWNLTPTGGPLAAALHPRPGGERRWGAGLPAFLRAWVGRSALWGITAEDLPDPENRVELDEAASDLDGLPGVRLRYAMGANARAILAFNVARARESLLAAGARDVLAFDHLPAFGWHQLGTARMGDDPASSVVDRHGRFHGLGNLLVADGSVMPTGSSVNPTATVCALALRAAERLLADRALVRTAA